MVWDHNHATIDAPSALLRFMIMYFLFTIKGDLIAGEKNYKEALEVLEDTEVEVDSPNVSPAAVLDNKLPLATAYQRIGWNMHKQGRNEEAVK